MFGCLLVIELDPPLGILALSVAARFDTVPVGLLLFSLEVDALDTVHLGLHELAKTVRGHVWRHSGEVDHSFLLVLLTFLDQLLDGLKVCLFFFLDDFLLIFCRHFCLIY